MFFTGVRYILFSGEHSNVVSDSKSDSMVKNRISQREKIKRLHLADDLFYATGKIKEIVIKTTDGKSYVIPATAEE